MKNKSEILVGAIALIVVASIGATLLLSRKLATAPVIEPIDTVSSSGYSISSSTPSSSSSSKRYIPPVSGMVSPKRQKQNQDPPQENSEIITIDPDGVEVVEIQRPEWSKPEQPPSTPPDDSATSTSQASSTPKQPKGGEKNNKGEIYVPGFGWLPHEPGGTNIEADYQLSGNIIGH